MVMPITGGSLKIIAPGKKIIPKNILFLENLSNGFLPD